MSANTPGPWIATDPNRFGTVHIRTEGPAPIAIAEVLQSDKRHLALANARLIAAAPDLYDALKCLLADHVLCGESKTQGGPISDAYAAITRAGASA